MGAQTTQWDVLAQHRERLLRIARRRVPVTADAEDCVQEALLRASTVTDVPPDRVGALLTTITVRLCVDWQRRHRVATRASAEYAGRRTVCEDPIEDVDDRAEARFLRRAVDDLAETERAVMLARADGQSVSEVARHLGITYKAAECALARARRKLRLVAVATAALVAFGRRHGRTLVTAPAVITVALTSALVIPGLSRDTQSGAEAVVPTRTPVYVVAERLPEARRAAREGRPRPPGEEAAAVRPRTWQQVMEQVPTEDVPGKRTGRGTTVAGVDGDLVTGSPAVAAVLGALP